MRLIKGIALLSILALCGCANICTHSGLYSGPAGIYRGTREDSSMIAAAFSKPISVEGRYAKAFATVTFPFLLIDWPFEVVADTITFPYDVFQDSDRSGEEN